MPEAEALVARHPLRERPWVLLVDALRAVGRTADALARYAEAHRLLDEELGIAPGPALRAAQARALRGGRRAGSAAASPRRRPGPAWSGGTASWRCWRGVLSGPGPRFVLVDGEPGIGKSRLVAEATAAATGARVAWGRCHEDDDAPALWPWRQVLAALTGDPEAVLAGPDDGAFAAFERMLRALVDASADRRVVVVLDDLHWADPASLRLLSFLAVELQHGPIAVLTTCRPVDDDPVVAQVRATLARTAGLRARRPRPAGRGGDGGTRRDGRRARPARRPGRRRSARPFGRQPVLRDRARAGAGRGARTVRCRPACATSSSGGSPSLPEDARTVLRLAAVAGQRFDVPLLQRAGAGPDDDALADALEAAEAAHLIRAEGPGRMAFAHALVRESLLADLPELRRSRLHARLAAALTTGDPFERAHHLVAGLPFTDTATTVAACAEAAEQAAREHAHENAARWWERALTALDADPGGRRARAAAGPAAAGRDVAGAGWLVGGGHRVADGDHRRGARPARRRDRRGGRGAVLPVGRPVVPGRLRHVSRGPGGPAGGGARCGGRRRCRGPGAGAGGTGDGLPLRARTGRAGTRESDRRPGAGAAAPAATDLLITALSARLSAAWLPGDEIGQIGTATELLDLAVGPDRADLAVLALRAARDRAASARRRRPGATRTSPRPGTSPGGTSCRCCRRSA